MLDESPRLLLVEEDETLADITAFRLELAGYDVRTANTGHEALQKIHDDPPDLVLLDPVLPDMDGIDWINRLKNDPRTNSLPIMIFSTDADLGAVEKAFSAGAVDYLVTPYDPAVLEKKLQSLLETAGKLH